jgi:hypothetical protein
MPVAMTRVSCLSLNLRLTGVVLDLASGGRDALVNLESAVMLLKIPLTNILLSVYR